MGAVKGKVKDFDKLMSKIKVEKNSVILDKNGIPFIKEGVKLTEREADTIFMIFSNLRNQLPAAAKSKPFKGKLDLKTGGYVSTLPMYEQALMGGGMVGIRKPSAIPPEKGPQPQGLDYLRYYGT